jgi:hypothetical protein
MQDKSRYLALEGNATMTVGTVPAISADPIEKTTLPAPPIASYPDSDTHLMAMWVSQHASPNTRHNYQRQANRFLTFVNQPLRPAAPSWSGP